MRVRAMLVVGMALALVGCSSQSRDDLAQAVADKPGVIDVRVGDAEGDDDVGTIPQNVYLTMSSDSTEDQIMAVLDEYADELRDQSVQNVSLDLVGKTTANLSIGFRPRHVDPLVTAMVAAVRERDMESVELRAAGNDVDLVLSPVGFSRVREVTTKYWDVLQQPQGMRVQSDGFDVVRDRKRITRFTTRMRVAEAVDREFGLTGARLSAYVPLELFVPPGTDVNAVSSLVRRSADPGEVGRFEVQTDDGVNLSGADGEFLREARRVVNAIRYDDTFRYAVIRDGELQIGADSVRQALALDDYYGSGEDPGYDTLPLGYVIKNGSHVGKVRGVSIHHYEPLTLAKQDEWSSFSWTQQKRQSLLRVDLREGVSARQAGRALARLGGTAASTIVWPPSTGIGTATITPDRLGESIAVSPGVDPEIRDQLLAGWAEGQP